MDAIADATDTIRAPGFRSGSAITAITEAEDWTPVTPLVGEVS